MENEGKFWTSDVRQVRQIEIGKSGTPEGIPPISVSGVFLQAVQKWPKKKAFHVKRNDEWQSWTWEEYYDVVKKVAQALIHLGLEEFDVVSVMGFNSPEWFFANVGTIFAGGICGGIYTTNSAEACRYQVEHSETKVVFLENDVQLKKFLQIKSSLPKLKAIVQWSGEPPKDQEGVYSWQDFLKFADNVPPSVVEEREKKNIPERCVQLIYTSGTTGRPKGVMLSHDNVTWTAAALAGVLNVTPEDSMISYLPLSHVAAMMLDLIAQMVTGHQIYFAKPDALKGSLIETLKEVRPTLFLGVPRVWEKIQERMVQIGKSKGKFVQSISTTAKGIGLEGSYALQKGEETPFGWWLANTFIFDNIKKALGLDRCRLAAVGAAPTSMDTLNYFMSLNIQIHELYGMSECTGPCSVNLPYAGKVKTGSAGLANPGTELKIHNPDSNGEGEIITKGRNVFLGYLKNAQATAECMDSNGFLHSGDLGKIDEKGFLFVTGRLKELIIGSGGENVSPILIENEITKTLGRLISNVMVIGDRRKFLTCMLTLAAQPNPSPGPGEYPFTDALALEAQKIVESLGSKATTVEEAIKDPLVNEHIKKGIAEANKQAISNAHVVQKFVIAPKDFTQEGEEITPTLKLKRKVVADKYKDLIETMYQE